MRLKKRDKYLLDESGIELIGIDKGFLPNGAIWLPMMLKEKKRKKKKSSDMYQYVWLLEMMPDAWVEFLTHDILVEDEKEYEEIWNIPTKSEGEIASHEYFFYSQKEITDRVDGS